MNENFVLFSPIGRSDPIRGNYDGPFLHIIRHYQPKKAYIFLTKEMWEYDLIDNRYEKAANSVMPNIQIEKINASEIIDAHNFLTYDKYFRDIFKKIEEENPHCEVLINVTSGTPQMQASLYVLSTQSKFKTKLIQVSSPAKRSNESASVSNNYDIEYEIKNNYDNYKDLNTENRCKEIEAINVRKIIIEETIISHIKTYDYNAALRVLEQSKELFKPELKIMLEAAKYRLDLDSSNAEKLAKQVNYDLYPLKSSDVKYLFEFILYLDIKVKRNELAEFSRAISPCLTHLFTMYLNSMLKIDIKAEYCKKFAKDRYMITLEKIPNKYNKYYNIDFKGNFRDSDLSAISLLPIIKAWCEINDRKEDSEKAQKLRDLEEKIRNPAAHNIVSISESIFEQELGIKPQKALEMIKQLFKIANPQYQKSINWDSYDKMNEDIISIYLMVT